SGVARLSMNAVARQLVLGVLTLAIALAVPVPALAQNWGSAVSHAIESQNKQVSAPGYVTTSATSESSAANDGATLELPAGLGGPDRWTSPEGLTSALEVMLLLTVISLAPALLMMTTCFVRIVVVLGLLRQALGTQQLPPTQVITSLAL